MSWMREENNKQEKSFVEQYVDYAEKCTSANRDYHKFVGYALLSAIIGRKMAINLSYGDVYPNLWVLLLGLPAVSHKSTSIKIGAKLLPENVNRLPQDSSPEGMIQSLSENGVGIHIRDEYGGFLSNLKQKYMQGYKETLNLLYDCPDRYERRLRKEKIELKNVCVSLLGATTKQRLLDNLDKEDIYSGLFARFIFIDDNMTDKEYKPITNKTTKMNSEEYALKQMLKKLSEKIEKIKKPWVISLPDDVLKRYNTWVKEQTNEVLVSEHIEEFSSIYERSWNRALKFAILEHVNKSINSASSVNSCFGKFGKKLTIEELETGIELAEKCCQYSGTLVTEVTEYRKYRISDDIERILKMIKRNPNGITRSSLLKNSNSTAKELTEFITTLEQRGDIEIIISTESNKPITKYKIKKSEEGAAMPTVMLTAPDKKG